MKLRLALAFVVFTAATFMGSRRTLAQDVLGYGGGMEERASTRVLFWNSTTDSPVGQFSIDYGRPEWKKEYEDKANFDAMTKGKVWRMGRDFWTTLDTSIPLKISGKSVAPGYYYLGLRRSADGAQWSLVFIDPAKARAAHLDGAVIEKAKVDFEVPVKVDRTTETASKLLITLPHEESTPNQATFKLVWGNLAVIAPIEAAPGK